MDCIVSVKKYNTINKLISCYLDNMEEKMFQYLHHAVVVENPNTDKQGSLGKCDQTVSTVTSDGEHGCLAETESSKIKEQELSTVGGSEFSDLNGHENFSADHNKIKSKNNADVTLYYTQTSEDGISSLTVKSREPVSAETDYNASSNTSVTYETLSEDNLSVDARACAYPKKKPKNLKLLTEKLADEEKIDVVYEKEKRSGTSKELSEAKSDNEIKSLIRHLVQKQFSCPNEMKFFDAAIVYDKRDYDEVIHFRNMVIDLVKSRLNEDLRIELFDSEAFAQSKIKVVEDVVEKCSVVLVYLSSNFTSPELHLFVEEAIGLSRLGYHFQFQAGKMNSQKQWVLKPVHTKPRKSRDYKTPIGLVTVNGIDWFDRSSEHTMNQILQIMLVAMTQRKQRDTEVNTNTAYVGTFGCLPDMPRLGPPFKKVTSVPNASATQTSEQTRNMLPSYPSNDAMSFSHGSAVSPAYQSSYSAVRIDTLPSFLNDAQGMPYHENRPIRISSHSPDDRTASRDYTRDEYLSWKAQHQDSVFVDQILPRTLESQQSFLYPHTRYPLYPDFNRTNWLENQEGQLAMQSNPQTIQGIAEKGYLSDTEVRQQQTVVRPPSSQEDPYQTQYISQDALRSIYSSHLPDNERQLSTGVVSSVTGKLIVKSNLSTDDDIEIDASKSDRAASSKHSKIDQYRNMRQDSEDDSDESDSSSDYDSNDDVSEKKIIKKVVNIVGCKTVQLGKGNRIKENTNRCVTSDKNAHKCTSSVERNHMAVAGKTDDDFQNKPPRVDNLTSKLSDLNISVSEDNMSMERSFSKADHCTLNGRYLSENINRLSDVEDRKQNIQEEVLPVSEPSDNSNIYRRTGADSKQRPKLQITSYRQRSNEAGKTDSVSFSPDDNISEGQLFGFGTEDDLNMNSNSSCRSQDAPFSFSQLAQKPDFKRMLHVGLNKADYQTLDTEKYLLSDLD